MTNITKARYKNKKSIYYKYNKNYKKLIQMWERQTNKQTKTKYRVKTKQSFCIKTKQTKRLIIII